MPALLPCCPGARSESDRGARSGTIHPDVHDDDVLADRLREVLADRPRVRERKMFGGLAFLINGRMAVAASKRELLVRADPNKAERLIATMKARPMKMRGRELRGWLHVPPEDVGTRRALAR